MDDPSVSSRGNRRRRLARPARAVQDRTPRARLSDRRLVQPRVAQRSPGDHPASTQGGPAAEPGWVRGDLHCHSLYSDGDSWPSELLVRAAELGLDFLAITDHNSALFPDCPEEPPGLPFLLPGIEVTTYGGHWNVWGLREWFDFREPTSAGVAAEMLRAAAAGGFIS